MNHLQVTEFLSWKKLVLGVHYSSPMHWGLCGPCRMQSRHQSYWPCSGWTQVLRKFLEKGAWRTPSSLWPWLVKEWQAWQLTTGSFSVPAQADRSSGTQKYLMHPLAVEPKQENSFSWIASLSIYFAFIYLFKNPVSGKAMRMRKKSHPKRMSVDIKETLFGGPTWRPSVGLTLCEPPTRLFCPWDFPGKNTRVGCDFLLQGIFRTQGSNPPLLH